MASEEAVPETSSQAGTAVDSVAVLVQMLAGDQIEINMPASSSVDEVKAFVAEARKLHPKCFQFIVGTEVVAGGEKLESLVQDGKASLALQLVKLDPLLLLGTFEFVRPVHVGLSIMNVGERNADCKNSKVVKTPLYPDSSAGNIFVTHRIREPCFVEFTVVRTGGQMSFGVTHKPEDVLETFGIANRSLRCTWIYSKQIRSMPTFFLGGVPLRVQDKGFNQGDSVVVFVDPEKRQVKFYRNGELIGDNLPNRPLPDVSEYMGEGAPNGALRIYSMIDAAHDEIRIEKFGPGEPFPDAVGAQDEQGAAPAQDKANSEPNIQEPLHLQV